VNVVTNSGSSEYHGNAEVVTDNWGGSFKETYDQNWYTFDLSGPIPGLDKAFFFGSIERRYQTDRAPSAVTPDDLPNAPDRLPGNWLGGWSYQGKIDYKFTENVQLALTGTGSREKWSEYLHTYLFNVAHTPYYDDKNLGINAKLTHTLNATTFYTFSGTIFSTERFRGDGTYREDLWSYGRPGGNPTNDQTNLFRAWDDMTIDTLGNQVFTPTVTDTIRVYSSASDTVGELKTFVVSGDESHVYDDYLKRKSSYFGFQGQITSEVTSEHTLKGGLEFNRHTLRFYQHFFHTRVWQGVTGAGLQDINR
jgi:hypothetical protein